LRFLPAVVATNLTLLLRTFLLLWTLLCSLVPWRSRRAVFLWLTLYNLLTLALCGLISTDVLVIVSP
jgi:hypothetical protein